MVGVKPKVVNVHEAKTHFSRLLGRVERGEEIVIARAGRPVARLSRLGVASKERVLGLDRDSVVIAGDFDAPLPDDLLKEFER